MGFKLSFGIAVFCLICFLETQGSFIKGKNIPRVGRSNEADGPFDQGAMGYVIKTIPAKNIPRMGRRNYDSQNRYDIPKFYQAPAENLELFGDDGQPGFNQEQIEGYYSSQLENMKK
ncbi:uncharacterized protein LOC134752737 [Cydia strobilella]|uniref:uncharacterized protein LOC134752737 n=1 Tax=Cydia strobilella TaxID=1100964 RepID=UPI0030045E1D